MEKLFTEEQSNNTFSVDSFLKKHEKNLKSLEGMNAYCNILDYVFNNNLRVLERSYWPFLQIVSFMNNFIQEDEMPFTPLVMLDNNVTGTYFREISSDSDKRFFMNSLLVQYNIPIKYVLYVPGNTDSLLKIKLVSLYKVFVDADNTSKKDYKSSYIYKQTKELCQWGVQNYPKMVANMITMHCVQLITNISSEYFPYKCAHKCYKNHIYHLENLVNNLDCIFLREKELFPFKKVEQRYTSYTLNMCKDLLKLLPFYREMCELLKNDFMFLLQSILRECKINKIAVQEYLAKCQHLVSVVNDTNNLKNIAHLKFQYEEYYRALPRGTELNHRNNNRSAWVFGPLNVLGQKTLALPYDVFDKSSLFKVETIKLNDLAPIINDAEESLNYIDIQEQLLSEYRTNNTKDTSEKIKKNSKTIRNHTKNSVKKSKNKEKKSSPTLKNKENAFDDDQILVPTAQERFNPQEELEKVIMDSPLTYLTSYLNRCKELYNDAYHNYPFVLDICVRKFGIPKKDLQDKSAVCYFWPIFVQSKDKAYSENKIYFIVQDENGIIFHRGPVAFENPNLYLKFRKDKECFNGIVIRALKDMNKSTQTSDYNANILSNSDLEDVNNVELLEENTTKIVDPFKGYFSSVINVFSHYIVINDFRNNNVIYFPLTF
jgi:hypothetical protein